MAFPSSMLLTKSYTYPNNPTIAFGHHKSPSEIRETVDVFSLIKEFYFWFDQGANIGELVKGALKSFIDSLCPPFSIYGVLVALLERSLNQTVKVQEELSALEERIKDEHLVEYFSGFEDVSQNLQNPLLTSNQEKIALLTVVFNDFAKIYPNFSNKDFFLYKKYYLGAPYLIELCRTLSLFLKIAMEIPGYSRIGLDKLRVKYLEALVTYKEKCIRERLLGIYIRWFDVKLVPLMMPWVPLFPLLPFCAPEGSVPTFRITSNYWFLPKLFPKYIKEVYGFGKTEKAPQTEPETVRMETCGIWHGFRDEFEDQNTQNPTFSTVYLDEEHTPGWLRNGRNTEFLHELALHEYQKIMVKKMEDFFELVEMSLGTPVPVQEPGM